MAATDSRNDAYIRDLPLLARLPDDDLKALASRGRVRRFTSGATIFHEGDPGDAIYVVVEGRIRKFYEEVVLLKQGFVMNPDITVEAALKEAEKTIGAPAKITGFVRFALGEGIEKEESDFAAEVAAAAKS